MEEVYDQIRYVLVVRLPRDVEVQIEDTFLSFAGSTKPSLGYHISLLGPFFLREGVHLDDALVRAKALCENWQAFPVRISGLDAFHLTSDQHLVYLQIANPAGLAALHNDLIEATRDKIILQNDQWSAQCYQPHVTLGLNVSNQELDEFLTAGRRRDFDQVILVEQIWLVEQEPQGTWRYIEGYLLRQVDTAQPQFSRAAVAT